MAVYDAFSHQARVPAIPLPAVETSGRAVRVFAPEFPGPVVDLTPGLGVASRPNRNVLRRWLTADFAAFVDVHADGVATLPLAWTVVQAR